MKKNFRTIKKLFLALLVFILCTGNAKGLSIHYNVHDEYVSSISGEANFPYIIDGDGISLTGGSYNAYCINPSRRLPGYNTDDPLYNGLDNEGYYNVDISSITTNSQDTSVSETERKAVYYSPGSPGWSETIRTQYVAYFSQLTDSSENREYFDVAHLYLSYLNGDPDGLDTTACANFTSYINSLSTPPSYFNVYKLRTTGYQDFIYWSSGSPSELTLTKLIQNPDGDGLGGFTFVLGTYNSQTRQCIIAEQGTTQYNENKRNTTSTGEIDSPWTGLDFSNYTYCVKELLNETKAQSYEPGGSDCNSNNDYILISDNNLNSSTGKYEATFCNKKKDKYKAIKVYKQDVETGDLLSGATFELFKDGTTTGKSAVTRGSTTTVDSNKIGSNCGSGDGYAVFAMVKNSGCYKVKETTADGTELYLGNSTTNKIKYWNSNGDNLLPSNNCLEMVDMEYDSTNDKYNCPSNFGGSNVLGNNKVTEKKQYYCLKVKKVDEDTGLPLAGAKFKASNGSYTTSEVTTGNDGVAVLFVGNSKNAGEYTITETYAPNGYTLASSVTQTASLMNVKDANQNDASACTITPVEVKDKKLTINWYKVDNVDNNKMLNGAEFTVKDSLGNYVNVGNSTQTVKDKDNHTKKCYIYTGVSSNASVVKSMNTETNGGTSNGEVCIAGLPSGTYTVTETKPSQYYAFGNKETISIETSDRYRSKIATSTRENEINAFKNCATEFKFTKRVENDFTNDINSQEYAKSTEELKRLRFNITYNNVVLKFKETENGYEYASGIEGFTRSNDTVTELKVNDSREFVVKYLPYGYNYKIKEVEITGCKDVNQNECESMGFYLSEDNPEWEITTRSSTCSNNGSVATASISNKVTEINFTKKDIYSYYDGQTKSEVESKFETDEEVQLFDTIDFVLKDKNGNRLKLEKISESNDCSVAGATSVYRYVGANSSNSTEIIHTKCGSIKIKHLCRDSEYYIEEVSVPNSSVFILPEPHPEVKFTTGKTSNSSDRDSQTHIIDNTPTRIMFQKRDLKYGYIISEPVGNEQTTFKVYRCNKGVSKENCNTSNSTLIKFNQREVIKDRQDNEDYGKEVYRYPESQNDSNLTSELHPYKGDLIIRYLPGGEFDSNKNYVEYNYILVETKAPKGYDLPTGGKEITRFNISTSTVSVDTVSVVNRPTKLILRKYDTATGRLLTGAKFKIYKVTNYDSNRNAKNQEKTLLKLKTIRDGEYEFRDIKDSDVITTCISECNKIAENLVSVDFINNTLENIEIREGEAIIQYLDADSYYVIEEIKSKDGYSLPNDDDRFKLVYMPKSVGTTDASIELYNTETVYQFYKFDEYGNQSNNLIDGAEFKLQKLNDKKKYIDINVRLDEERTNNSVNANVYVVDSSSNNKTITTKNGSAMIYRLEEGQYRILETKAPAGKELPKKRVNAATFFVDGNGNVYGSSIITNKAKTETYVYNPSATAELIVNIQTGQAIVRYGLIISVLVILIFGLIYLQRKKK